MIPKRICVCPKDIEVITGKGERYSRKVVQKIRESLGKEKHQYISYEELADYLGLDRKLVFKSINNMPIIDLNSTG